MIQIDPICFLPPQKNEGHFGDDFNQKHIGVWMWDTLTDIFFPESSTSDFFAVLTPLPQLDIRKSTDYLRDGLVSL